MRKTLIAIALVAAIGFTGLEARLAIRWRDRIRTLEEQPPRTGPLEQLRREIDGATNGLVAAQQENQQLQREHAELPALRGEAARLRKDSEELARRKAAAAAMGVAIDDWRLPILDQLKQSMEQWPETKIPELQLLTGLDWLGIAQYDQIRLAGEDQVRESLSVVRNTAKHHFVRMLWEALAAYTNANGGQLPTDLAQLQPCFRTPVDSAILQRYQILQTGNVKDAPSDKPWATEKGPADHDHDDVFEVWTKDRIHFQSFKAAERERQSLLKLGRPAKD